MNKNDLKIFSAEGPKFYDKNISFIALSRSSGRETALIVIGSIEKNDHLIKSWKTATGFPHFENQFIKISGVLFLFFGKNEGIFIRDNELPSTLGFNGIHDGSGYHIGYKMLKTFENLTMANDEEKTFAGRCG